MSPFKPAPGFVDKWHPYGNIDPFFAPEAADRLLNEYFHIAELLKLNTFLLYGTSLGFFRDRGYIKGDNDIDVGILEGFHLLAPALVKNGFSPLVIVRENAHFLKYGILLDVWFSFPSVRHFQSFDKVTHNNRLYNLPHPIEEFLTAAYGNWKVKSSNQALRR